MQRKDVFDLHKPTPLDVNVYPIWKDFIKLQNQILQAVQTNHDSQRGISNAQDFRVKVSNTGIPVISFTMINDPHIDRQLRLYTTFFTLYRNITTIILIMVREYIDTEQQVSMSGKAPSRAFEIYFHNTAQHIASVVKYLKVIVFMMQENLLEEYDFSQIHEALSTKTEDFYALMRQMIIDKRIENSTNTWWGRHISNYHSPKLQATIQGYRRYVRNNPDCVSPQFMLAER